MDMLGDDTDIQAILGRDDEFVGIENDTLPDFTQLEHFINSENDEQNNYFADTLANQEASRHSGPVGDPSSNGLGGDSSSTNSSSLMATHRPVGVGHHSGRMGNQPSAGVFPQHPPQPPQHHVGVHGMSKTASLTGPPQYGHSRQGGASIHCGGFNVSTHAMPESPPDSASEPPYSPPETNRSSSSIGGSPLNDHCSSQRYVLPSETYGSLFSNPGLELKNELVVNSQQHFMSSPAGLVQPQSGMPSILSASLLQSAAGGGPAATHSVGLASCTVNGSGGTTSNPMTPTIYTIEDHGGGHPLVNLGAPVTVAAASGSNKGGTSAGQKKRKLSLTDSFSKVKQEPQLSPGPSSQSPRQVGTVGADEDYSYEFSADSSMFNDSYQCIRFQAFQQNTWHLLYDCNLKELPAPNYRVDADKGFNFSNTDEAFVCQKKNHFQITCHVQQSGEPYYVKSAEGFKKVDNFYLHFFGVKAEAPTQMIRVEQSQSDRSKKPFHPVLLELQQDQVSKITVGRLHFNETTANNMRKKGKPNPDQRFFNLVVSLQAHCGESTYTVVAHSSERIIVRASNPGMFENEVEQNWQRGTTTDSVFHSGRVGINTDRPDEALVVHGNLKITGHLVQPSDRRAKEAIHEADTKEQLRNVQALRVVHYKYTEEFAETAGLKEDERADTGVIAQELEAIIPDAVRPAGNIVLPDGRQIENFLVVNKERIFMENVGAVKELCKVTGNLETRIDELERMNHNLTKLKRVDSIRSSASGSTGKPALSLDLTHVSNVASNVVRRPKRCGNVCNTTSPTSAAGLCANRFVQAIVVILVMIMALCLIAMATLYILEWQKRNSDIILAGQRISVEHHTVLNYTEPSLEDYAFMSDSGHSSYVSNKTSDPPDDDDDDDSVSPPVPARNASTVTAMSSSRSVPLHGGKSGTGRSNATAPPGGGSTRAYMSLTSTKPDPVGKPENCPIAPASCQTYCCVAAHDGPAVVSSTTAAAPAISPGTAAAASRRVDGGSEASATYVASTESSAGLVTAGTPMAVSSQSSITTEMLTNNVDNLHLKEGKSRNFRGPSDGGSLFDSRANYGQLFFQKAREKKPVRVARLKRHLSTQQRDGSSRGPSDVVDYMSTRTRTPSVKPTQPTVWDGRVSYIRLLGAAFNVTLGPSYCMSDSDEYIRCLNGDAVNYTYGIPLSRHMPDRSLTLQFHFTTAISLPPDQCTSPVRLGACPDGQRDLLGGSSIQRGPTLNHPDSVARTFFVDVGRSSIVAYRLRFPVSRGDTTDLCDKPSASLGDKFVEYNLVFYRVCDD